jgi:hypothetical protein
MPGEELKAQSLKLKAKKQLRVEESRDPLIFRDKSSSENRIALSSSAKTLSFKL